MPGVALLVFRQVMEAALIVSTVCAATRGVARRGWFVAAGIGILIGYDAHPPGIQLVFCATASLLLLVVGMQRPGRTAPSPSPRMRSPPAHPASESVR
ncbi:MAG: hypothetical protein WBW92_11805 [Rhodanobacteraceae bacterium]